MKKNNFVRRILLRSLKEALGHWLILEKFHKVTQFSQKAWLKPYIDINTKLTTTDKNNFEKDFFKLMSNSTFRTTLKNVRKYTDINRVTTSVRESPLVSDPSYHTTKWFSENLLEIEMNKTEVKIGKPVYLDLSIVDVSKIAMYEYWYDFIKQMHGDEEKPCYTDTGNFIVYIKSEDIYGLAGDIKKRSDTLNYEIKRPLPIAKTKKVIGLMKNELSGKTIKKVSALKPNTYSYIIDDDHSDKKAKDTKKCVVKWEIRFQDFQD